MKMQLQTEEANPCRNVELSVAATSSHLCTICSPNITSLFGDNGLIEDCIKNNLLGPANQVFVGAVTYVVTQVTTLCLLLSSLPNLLFYS